MRKIVLIVMTVILVMGTLATAAFAQGVELLKIDNDKVYTGMTSSYDGGYSPVQSGDTITIVLPLVLANEANTIAGDITVTPGLGDTASSPFVFNNYQKAFSLITHSTDKGDSAAYLVQFSLPLSSDRYEGRYPVALDVKYSDSLGELINQQFTVYVTVDGQDPNPKPTDTPIEKPRSQPKLIVSNYTVTPNIVKAGEEFEINVTIRNTSEKYYARNIKVSYSGDGVNIMPADNVTTQYIDLIEDGQSHDIKFRMLSRLDSAVGIHKVTLNVEYEDSKTTSYSMSDEIFLQVTQPVTLEIDEPTIPQTANAGDSMPITLTMFNKGRSKVYNVMCKISAQGLIPEGSVFVGNMEPGSTGIAELYVFVGMLTMSANEDGGVETDRSSDEKYGYTNGVITITYEDEFGEEFSQEIMFDMVIEPPVIAASTKPEEIEEPDTVSQWWISVAIAAFVIAGFIAIFIIRSKRKAKAYNGDGLDD